MRLEQRKILTLKMVPLRPYGINSKPIRFGGEVQKGYRREDFKEAFRRYLPRRPKEVTSVEGKQNEEFPSQNHIRRVIRRPEPPVTL